MPKLAWYVKRLRVMSAHEILHRVRHLFVLSGMYLEYLAIPFRFGKLDKPAQYEFCSAPTAQLPQIPFDLDGLESAAPQLLLGQVSVAGRLWQWEDSTDVWHKAPDTGHSWPQRFFAIIRYREQNSTGDVRVVWEPSRLQQLVDLAILAVRGDPERRRQACSMITAQLESWMVANPPLRGVHYISAMECGLRLIAVCHALDLIRSDLRGDSAWRHLIRLVSSHATLIERRLSRFSSTGNHTTAEAAGLVYAGFLFPEAKGAKRWRAKGLALLDSVSRQQVLPDGGGVEQALAYHLFNLQLLALVHQLLVRRRHPVPASIPSAVQRGTRFLSAFRLEDGRLLPIGDSDSGNALSRWLQLCLGPREPDTPVVTFRDAGYTVARIASKPVIWTAFDHGPLGLLPSSGHGHADALSLLLNAAGETVLVDPGTYTYTGDLDWRSYFRSTAAHNTVTVDGRDQATQQGCFMWTRPYRAWLIASETAGAYRGRLLAEHDGYHDLGVRHIRGIGWLTDRWLLIWDRLLGHGKHRLDLHWHIAQPPNWNHGEGCKVTVSNVDLELRFQGGMVREQTGGVGSRFGWRSRQYGSLEAITTIRVSHDGLLPHTFLTLIRLPGVKLVDNDQGELLTWFEEQIR